MVKEILVVKEVDRLQKFEWLQKFERLQKFFFYLLVWLVGWLVMSSWDVMQTK